MSRGFLLTSPLFRVYTWVEQIRSFMRNVVEFHTSNSDTRAVMLSFCKAALQLATMIAALVKDAYHIVDTVG